ncbi:hypothetical protein H2198_009372 [Neophaeococcomyces mojaviensis]|uniref:Uncharacterized protein n=1 Tax=Neophaeococcomyces mojaviensis TaxID=3383035 RepID=A0ACC2ZUT6_9EURO|nr:hypothetical protein H2198_009372 [Knufia sp. JES_112]
MAILDHNSDGESQNSRTKSFEQRGQYTMPPESAHHSHTLMAFPSIHSADGEEHLRALQAEVIRIANTISKFEPVHLYARSELIEQAKSLADSNVFVKPAIVTELWIRDSGPVYVYDTSNKNRIAVNFNFNYWGGKLALKGDGRLAAQIAEQSNENSVRSRLTIEGGGIEHDGEGTFLGTESCIINDNRNKGMTKAEAEAELRQVLGVTTFIWVPGVKGHEITDYHIDALARFVAPGVVLLSRPAPNAHPVVSKAFEETRAILLKSKDAKGRSITVFECEEPDITKLGSPDQHNEVVASYANYLLVNGAVVIPKFGQDKLDSQAFELFQQLFPSREIVQVLINMLPRTGGGIHCATQQVPQI